MNITIYSKNNCPNCTTAKRLLDSKGIGSEELDVVVSEHAVALFTRYPEVKQLPQIFIDGQRVGGLAGLQAALHQLGK